MADERDAQFSDDDAGGVAVLYETARWRLDEQLERVRSLDNKLAATFTLNAAVVALFGAAMALADRAMPYYVWGLELAVLCVFLVNLAFTYRAYRQKNWSVRPHLNDLRDLISAYPDDAIRAWVVSEITASLEHNEVALAQKGRDSRVALAAAIVDAALIGVAAVAATAPFA